MESPPSSPSRKITLPGSYVRSVETSSLTSQLRCRSSRPESRGWRRRSPAQSKAFTACPSTGCVDRPLALERLEPGPSAPPVPVRWRVYSTPGAVSGQARRLARRGRERLRHVGAPFTRRRTEAPAGVEAPDRGWPRPRPCTRGVPKDARRVPGALAVYSRTDGRHLIWYLGGRRLPHRPTSNGRRQTRCGCASHRSFAVFLPNGKAGHRQFLFRQLSRPQRQTVGGRKQLPAARSFECSGARVLVLHRLQPENLELLPQLDAPHAQFTRQGIAEERRRLGRHLHWP